MQSNNLEKSSDASRSSWLSIGIGVSVGLISKIIEQWFVPPQAPVWLRWTLTSVLTLSIAYLLFIFGRRYVLRRLSETRERSAETQSRDQVLAVAVQFLQAMSPSFVRSAGNVLQSLTVTQVIDAQSHNQYLNHLSTLSLTAQWLITDLKAGRLTAAEALARLVMAQQNYVRLCRTLAEGVRTSKRQEAYLTWDEIRDHANSMSQRLRDIDQQMRIARGEEADSIYLDTVPRISLASAV